MTFCAQTSRRRTQTFRLRNVHNMVTLDTTAASYSTYTQLTQPGCVSFIDTLLVMAGVERNPGPSDTFNFRYQYILIELGAEVLRNIFNEKIGNDFNAHLNSNPPYLGRLHVLIRRGVITESQKTLIPPLCNTPNVSLYDITLLTCLLRNICGLKTSGDQVWMNPGSADFCIEADICRLRNCRNELVHSGSVMLSDSDLQMKTNQLTLILLRLNKKLTNSVPNLQDKIDKAMSMHIDKVDKDNYETLLKDWEEMDNTLDHGIAGLSSAQAGLKRTMEEDHDEFKSGLSDVKVRVTELKVSHDEMRCDLKKMTVSPGRNKDDLEHKINDLKKSIIMTYSRDCARLPVSPIFEEEDEDLFRIYTRPGMYVLEYNDIFEKLQRMKVSKYSTIFNKGANNYANVYISGDAGTGKTSYCQRMCLLWCKAQSGEKSRDRKLQADIDTMATFDFVFYVSLRDMYHTHVEYMIERQLFDTEGRNGRLELIESVLKLKKCLVILDGLDEWTPLKAPGSRACKIPFRIKSENCVYLTTTRPYKLESIRLSTKDIEFEIHLDGIDMSAVNDYVKNIVEYLNERFERNKRANDFLEDVKGLGLNSQLTIPIISTQLIVLWFDEKLEEMTKAEVYANTLEMLFRRSAERKVSVPAISAFGGRMPAFVTKSRYPYTSKYGSLLHKISRVAFESLLSTDKNVSSLVFTRMSLASEPYFLSQSESDYLCSVGILSRNKVIGRMSEDRKQKLSFINRSYCEFFAAMYVAAFDTVHCTNRIVQIWTSLNSVLSFGNFLIFLAGMSFQKVEGLFLIMYEIFEDEFTSHRVNNAHESSYSSKMNYLQNLIVDCSRNGRSSGTNTLIKLEDCLILKKTDHQLVGKLIAGQGMKVKSLYFRDKKPLGEFLQVTDLRSLRVVTVSENDVEKIAGVMLQNSLTLYTVGISGRSSVISSLPFDRLHLLSSLCLQNFRMKHDHLDSLTDFLSANTNIQYLTLEHLDCSDHKTSDEDGYRTDSTTESVEYDVHEYRESVCTFNLDLSKHVNLISLCLCKVDFICPNVHNAQLKKINLFPSSNTIESSYISLFKSLDSSGVTDVDIKGGNMLGRETVKLMIATLKNLSYLKSLRLGDISLYDLPFSLSSSLKKVEIHFHDLRFLQSTYQSFVDSIVKNNYLVTSMVLGECRMLVSMEEALEKLTLGEVWKKQAESTQRMIEYVKTKPYLNITFTHGYELRCETRCFNE